MCVGRKNGQEAPLQDQLPQPFADGPGPQIAPGEEQVSKLIKSVLTASDNAEQVRLADDVLLMIVHDGSGRLIDLSGQVSAVTQSGAAMLELALRGGSDSACKILAARYGVAEDVIRADLESLFKLLENQGTLVPASATADKRSLSRTFAGMAYPLVAICARRPLRGTIVKAYLLTLWAFVATRALGWGNAMQVWDRVGARLASTRDKRKCDPAVEAAIDAAVTRAIAGHPLTVNCKERALTAWVLARAAGLPARVQLGITLFPFGLHCWCENGAVIIADRYEGRCDRYTPILTYG
jgi:hypothetical protein